MDKFLLIHFMYSNGTHSTTTMFGRDIVGFDQVEPQYRYLSILNQVREWFKDYDLRIVSITDITTVLS